MKQPKLRISVARDFAKAPIGRFRTDGPQSGEVFRVQCLRPALEKAEIVEVDLDGTEGYGSSFLEEAFGGLIRERMSLNEFERRLVFKSEEDPTLIAEIKGYVEQESQRSAA